MYDSLTGKKVDKTYTIVYLENEYIRIGVLPEIADVSLKAWIRLTTITSSIASMSSSRL